MKKQSTLILALVICYSTAICQTPAITMTSSLDIGTTIYFHVRGTSGANPEILIDFGNGILESRIMDCTPLTGPIGTDGQDIISGMLSGSKTVKIYSTGISGLACYFVQNYLSDSLTSLDVSNCNTLEALDCCYGCLTTLDLSVNTHLNYLVCSFNQLPNLDVSNCSTLKLLDCSVNQITTLDLSENTLLNHLACSFNQLSNLNASYHDSLKYLDCRSNKLTTLDISKNTVLKTLYCAGNPITTLDISNNILLGELRCSSNNLTTLDLSRNTVLGFLDCSSNNLTNLDVSNNTVLIWLICSQNLITTLDVGSNTFLKSLNCGGNPITSLDISHTESLTSLNCNACQLTSLDVSHNSTLTGLSCAYNQLTSLDVSKNTDLMTLRCPDNRLTSLDLSANTILNELDCSNNLLSGIDVTHNTGLIFLYCWNNKLTSMAVNVSLIIAVCNNNQLTFATLPITGAVIGAPQAPIPIEKTLDAGVELDLSSQLTVNGNTTVYTWKTKSGATLVQGTDYSLTEGKTIFLKSQSDSVYCEMTNATFPLFTGNDVLKTTFTKVSVNTGMDNANAPVVQIYTLNKTLYIIAPYKGQASVYDINGRLAMAKEITTGINTIALPQGGVYVVRFTGSNTPVIKKVFAGN